MEQFGRTPWYLFLALMLLGASLPAMAQYGRVVSCDSDDMRRHWCEIGPNDGVRVARQHSEARCVEGQSYGVRGRTMWVDRGCRAEFQIIPERGGRGDDNDGRLWRRRAGGRGDGSSASVYCASDNMRRNYCAVGAYRTIRLVRKRSDAACDLNRTYGFDRGGIWVDRGCRAEFEVLMR